jgi:hypothetical protein
LFLDQSAVLEGLNLAALMFRSPPHQKEFHTWGFFSPVTKENEKSIGSSY